MKKTCGLCGGDSKMSHEFDAHYCDRCNEWLEEKCSQEDCEFCGARPEYPLFHAER